MVGGASFQREVSEGTSFQREVPEGMWRCSQTLAAHYAVQDQADGHLECLDCEMVLHRYSFYDTDTDETFDVFLYEYIIEEDLIQEDFFSA